jgi:hypothetical protein
LVVGLPCTVWDPTERFVEGEDRSQTTLFPESLGDWVDEENPVHVIDAFVEALDLAGLKFEGLTPQVTGRPGSRRLPPLASAEAFHTTKIQSRHAAWSLKSMVTSGP